MHEYHSQRQRELAPVSLVSLAPVSLVYEKMQGKLADTLVPAVMLLFVAMLAWGQMDVTIDTTSDLAGITLPMTGMAKNTNMVTPRACCQEPTLGQACDMSRC